MSYCDKSDLVLGPIPLGGVINEEQFITRAAEEIDIMLGTRFKTPIQLADTPANRPLKIILKRINSDIASGRILLAASLASEEQNLNAYGQSLLQGGLMLLAQICDNAADYPGLDPIEGDPEARDRQIIVLNQDSRSGVDAFYESVAPYGLYPDPSRRAWLW